MDYLKTYLNTQVLTGIVLTLVVFSMYFLYRWFHGETTGFLDLGAECDPQIENTCGQNARCQPDETGEKGVCFPNEEDEENVNSE